nr:hypothetical protein Itr_chr01CG08130 [Ipomoea trifida]
MSKLKNDEKKGRRGEKLKQVNDEGVEKHEKEESKESEKDKEFEEERIREDDSGTEETKDDNIEEEIEEKNEDNERENFDKGNDEVQEFYLVDVIEKEPLSILVVENRVEKSKGIILQVDE